MRPSFYIKQLSAMVQRANLENIPKGAMKRKSCRNAHAVILESAQGYLAPLRVAIGTNAQYIFSIHTAQGIFSAPLAISSLIVSNCN